MKRVVRRIVAWVLLLLIHTSLGAGSVVPTITDSYNNVADSSSNIQWAPIPAGQAYSAVNATATTGMAALFSAIHTFVGICFTSEFPYDTLLSVLDNTFVWDQDSILGIVKFGAGFVICIIIGVLFFLLFPIIGSCFCCCRTCCKKCGGKMVQKRNSNTGCFRCFYIISLLLSCTMLGVGMVCTYFNNDMMSRMLGTVSSSLTSNKDNFLKYANNTVMQVNYIAFDGFNFTARVINRDLDYIGPLIGGAVQADFNQKANVDTAFTELLNMDPLLKNLIDELTAVKITKTAVTTSVTALGTALTSLKNDIDATKTSCGAACGSIDTTGMSTNFDPSQMPSFDTQLNQLNSVYAQNITALVLDGKKQFENISNIVEEKAAPIVSNIKAMVNSFSDTIGGALGSISSLTSQFDGFLKSFDTISDLENMAIAQSLTVKDIEHYRWMAGTTLTCFILLILVLQSLGLLCACCGCSTDRSKLPTERGGCGNCAAYMLMASVGLVFMFAWLLMLLVLLPFLVGAPLEKLACAEIRDPAHTAFKKLIDGGPPTSGVTYRTVFGPQDGYTLGTMLLQNSSIPLTVSDLLDDCKADKPAWEALHIGALFNIDQLTNYKSQIDIDGPLNSLNVDLSSLVLLDNNTRSQIEQMRDSAVAIPFSGLTTELSKSTTAFSFAPLRTALQTVANGASGSVQTQLNGHIATLNGIEQNEYANVLSAKTDMLNKVETLNNTVSTLPNQINTMLQVLATTQTTLQNQGANIIKNQSKIYALRVIGIADQFVSFVLNGIKTDVAKCSPVWSFYESVFENLLCGTIVDTWNSFWFSLGWCIAFMVVGIIFSTKLAKHVRKMDKLHEDDVKRQNTGSSAIVPRKTQVEPMKNKHPI